MNDKSQAPAVSDITARLGLQLWSLRVQAKESMTRALDLTVNYGLKLVETAGTGTLSAAQFARELAARGLSAPAAHAGYEALQADTARVIADAKAVGARYVIMPWLPHDQAAGLNAEGARHAADHFNAWGEACRTAGLAFGWHPHGFEFVADAGGVSPFDIIVNGTAAELVTLEMDVFWIYHAGRDPLRLLRDHPSRWRLLHVKDMRKGAPTGFATGAAPATDKVAVGSGQIDWPVVLRAAELAGVQYYFVEDEGPQPLEDIPAGVAYLQSLRL